VSTIEKIGEKLCYLIIFGFIIGESIQAIIGVWIGDKDMMFKGIRGVGLQVLILMIYLHWTGKLFNKKE
jgi:hypothetical protein